MMTKRAYKKNIEKKNQVIEDLNFISQKAFCYRTFYKAKKKFEEIKSLIPDQYRDTLAKRLLWCDPNYPDSGWGGAPYIEREMLAGCVKEIIKYIEETY